jgi:TonB family protein
MPQAKYAIALMVLAAAGLWAQNTASPSRQYHQVPDQDGVYYVGPEVSAPKMISTVLVPYPFGIAPKAVQGMTVFAMVIDPNGIPAHVQILHTHGEAFDQAATAALKQSKFEPGRLDGKPVPVWIDVRVVFHANLSEAVPQVLIAERDLPPPDVSQLEDKRHNPLPYTPPFPIHTVDADFADPFSAHPYVQAAIVTVQVSEEGLPKEVRVVRGLGFGLDKKAEAAVWHYRFLPATKKGKPIAARRNVMVSFAKF